AEGGVARDDRAADDVAVAVEVFRGRVDDDIGAELDRSLEGGREEGVVDDDDRRLGVMRCGGEATDVGDAEQWIARRLDPEQARLASSDLLRCARRREVGEYELEVLFLGERTQEPLRSAVAVVR